MSFESMLGYHFIFDLFLRHPENFILLGGIVSYIVFIIADGYKKLRTGFLPDYLGLYAMLTVISALLEGASQKLVEYFALDISQLTTTLSWIFALSNDAMNIVAMAVMFFFAIYSLYTNCGLGAAQGEKQPDTKDKTQDDAIDDSL